METYLSHSLAWRALRIPSIWFCSCSTVTYLNRVPDCSTRLLERDAYIAEKRTKTTNWLFESYIAQKHATECCTYFNCCY